MIPAVDGLSGPGVRLRPLDWRDVDLVMAASRTDVPDWTFLPRDLDEHAAAEWIGESMKARIDGSGVRFVIAIDGHGAEGVHCAGQVHGVGEDAGGAGEAAGGAGEAAGGAGEAAGGAGEAAGGAAGIDRAGVVAAYAPPEDATVVGTSYFLLPQHRGRGFATAALMTLSTWLSSAVPGLRRLELMVVPGNDASERVALRAGYRRQGVVIDAVPPVNGFPARDAIVYTRTLPSKSEG